MNICKQAKKAYSADQELENSMHSGTRTRKISGFFAPDLCREAIEYKTLRGNTIGCLCTVFNLPTPALAGVYLKSKHRRHYYVITKSTARQHVTLSTHGPTVRCHAKRVSLCEWLKTLNQRQAQRSDHGIFDAIRIDQDIRSHSVADTAHWLVPGYAGGQQ